MNKDARIYVAGHSGLVGSALMRQLTGYEQVITRSFNELDLRCQTQTGDFFASEKPEYVFLSAAKVGGVAATMKQPAAFLMENLQIQCNVIDSAFRHEVKKLLFIASAVVYPKHSEQPINEDALLTGALEPTNEGYALAKMTGLKLCMYYNRQYGTDYTTLVPCSMYGYNDNFDLETSPFMPALIRKFYEAKKNNQDHVTIWGTGKPCRELLFADDFADACMFIMQNNVGGGYFNVGAGSDNSIAEMAEMVKKIAGYEGAVVYDTSKPDGMMRRVLDSSKIRALGWQPKTSLEEGIAGTYRWYAQHKGQTT